jgi:hypothetical protein
VTRIVLLAALLAAGCVEEPTPADVRKAAEDELKNDVKGAVKETKKSIEEAADAAAKLVEEEARQEIEEVSRADDSDTNEGSADTVAR